MRQAKLNYEHLGGWGGWGATGVMVGDKQVTREMKADYVASRTALTIQETREMPVFGEPGRYITE